MFGNHCFYFATASINLMLLYWHIALSSEEIREKNYNPHTLHILSKNSLYNITIIERPKTNNFCHFYFSKQYTLLFHKASYS